MNVAKEKPTNIAFIGMMGSGKSTIAKLVAEQLGLQLVDLDREIEKSMGAPIADIFANQGEAAFRAVESEHLEKICDNRDQVIACGGGAILSITNRSQLLKQFTVYLSATSKTLTDRLQRDTTRPLLNPAMMLMAQVEQLMDNRRQMYHDCAKITLKTDDLAPQALCSKVVQQFEIATR